MQVRLAGIGMPGVPELLIILLIVALLFGTTRIPALGRAMGEGLGALRKGLRDLNDELKKDHNS